MTSNDSEEELENLLFKACSEGNWEDMTKIMKYIDKCPSGFGYDTNINLYECMAEAYVQGHFDFADAFGNDFCMTDSVDFGNVENCGFWCAFHDCHWESCIRIIEEGVFENPIEILLRCWDEKSCYWHLENHLMDRVGELKLREKTLCKLCFPKLYVSKYLCEIIFSFVNLNGSITNIENAVTKINNM